MKYNPKKITAMKKKKKHGIFIKEGKFFNIKMIYNQGKKLYQYDFIPKKIYFKSPMINDFNQHLSGGWYVAEMPTEEDVKKQIFQRTINRKKPFGVLCQNTLEEAKQYCEVEKLKGLFCEYQKREKGYQVILGQKGNLNDLFDLEALKKDYSDFDDIVKEIGAKKYKKLSEYIDTWDTELGAKLWETGLILGYPIENTLSLYYKDLNKIK